MTTEVTEAVLTLDQIAQAEAFPGFTEEDFAVFELPGFAARMPELKGRITPKLKQIGAALRERLAETLGETVYPHVAQHLRRSVNAPVETWVAFARQARAYKPYVHLRVGISAERARVTVFVEDYADEKALFAANLSRNGEALAAYFATHPTILAFEMQDPEGQPLRGHALAADRLLDFAGRMQRVKGQHAVFGITFARTHPVLASGPEFLDSVLDAARALRPLYDCGKPGFEYTYTPEPIEGI